MPGEARAEGLRYWKMSMMIMGCTVLRDSHLRDMLALIVPGDIRGTPCPSQFTRQSMPVEDGA